MDVAIMQMVAEMPAGQPAKAAGKSAGKADAGGFAAVFAGMTDADSGDATAADADATATGETAGMMPAMWNFAAIMPLPATQPQATAAQPTAAAAGVPPTMTGVQFPPPVTVPAAGQGRQPDAAVQPGRTAAVPVNGQEAFAAAIVQQQDKPAVGSQPAMPLPAAPAAPAPPVTATTPAPQAGLPAQAAATAAQPAAMADSPAQVAAMAPPPVPAAAEAPPAAKAADTATQPAAPAMAALIRPQAPSGERPANAVPAAGNEAQAEAAALPTAPAKAPAPTAADGDRSAGDHGATLTAERPVPAADNGPAPAPATGNQAFAALVDRQLSLHDTAGTASGPQAPPAADPYNVAGQIVDHARLITKAATSEMVIKLKPEHLGEMTLKIAVENGAVTATFHTPNADVRSAIEASLPQLKQDMASQGLKVDYVGVYASLDQFFANDQHRAPQQQMVRTARRPKGEEVFTEAIAAVAAAPPGSLTASGGIDYRI